MQALSKSKITTFVTIAIGGSIGVLGMNHLLAKKVGQATEQQNFLQEAVSRLKEQPEVKEILGEFEVGRVNMKDSWNRIQDDHVNIMMPIKGDKDSGQLLMYARRLDSSHPLYLSKVEVRFKGIAGKKLVLYEASDEELQRFIGQSSDTKEIRAVGTEKERLIKIRREQAEISKKSAEQALYRKYPELKNKLTQESQS